MIKLRSYRPFVTENLSWDFPSRYKLKDVSEFMQENISDVTGFISATAKDIMRNECVYWFVEDKKTHVIVALIEIKDVDFDYGSATISAIFSKNLSAKFEEEISKRLLTFLHDQISLNLIKVENIPDNLSKFFTSQGYTLDNNFLKRK